MYNDHYFYSENLDVRRQIRWGGCDIGIMSRISRIAIDKFRCIWIAMIGKIYKLIVKYLGNRFR